MPQPVGPQFDFANKMVVIPVNGPQGPINFAVSFAQIEFYAAHIEAQRKAQALEQFNREQTTQIRPAAPIDRARLRI